MESAFAAQHLDVCSIDDAKFQSEFFLHFCLPLNLQTCGTYHKDSSCSMPNQKLLYHQPGFNRFPQSNIVGNQKIYPCHVNSANQWIKLVIFNRNAAPEWCLQELPVGVRRSPPTNGIKKSVELVIGIKTGNGGKTCSFKDLCSRLQLPNNL